jgi:ribose transport system permease protein
LAVEFGALGADSGSAASGSGLRSLIGNLLFGTRFATIWLATGVLAIVCAFAAPSTFTSASWSSVLPFGSLVVILALGQMLVIMVGGIDLSMAANISLLANILVGVTKGQNDRMTIGVVAVIAVAIVIGFVNGVLVAVVELNPLIVTLSMKFILDGANSQYRLGTANNSTVPDSLSAVVIDKFLGVSKAFWAVLALTLVVSLMLRSSTPGRRFQTVGANRRAAWMAGIHVRTYVVMAYIGASIAAGLGAILLSGLIQSPGPTPGTPYLLGPVAAVVLGGAALSGGLASPWSTWVAAFFVQVLNQMLRILGLENAWQNVVFGLAIIVGMVVSGDRIADIIGRVLLRSSARAEASAAESVPRTPSPERVT